MLILVTDSLVCYNHTIDREGHMIRVGTVVQAQGENLQVCFNRLEACDSCGMCDAGKRDTVVTLQGKAQVGDTVEVEMPDAKVLKTSAMAYLIPLVGLIAGLWLGSLLFADKELQVLGIGVIGLAAGLLLVKLLDITLGKKAAWQPKIIAVTPKENGTQLQN